MKYDPLKHQRRSQRLSGYDYASPGAYFVTIVTYQRVMFFEQPAVRALAEACWRAIPAHAPNVTLDEWVVMPNHVHGIIVINELADNGGNINVGRGVQLNAPTLNERTSNATDNRWKPRDPDNVFSMISARSRTLSVIVRTYKATVTTACRRAQLDFAWQRGFYEHVVRSERELSAIRRYIRENPLKWALDRDNPANGRPPAASADDYLRDIN